MIYSTVECLIFQALSSIYGVGRNGEKNGSCILFVPKSIFLLLFIVVFVGFGIFETRRVPKMKKKRKKKNLGIKSILKTIWTPLLCISNLGSILIWGVSRLAFYFRMQASLFPASFILVTRSQDLKPCTFDAFQIFRRGGGGGGGGHQNEIHYYLKYIYMPPPPLNCLPTDGASHFVQHWSGD